MHHRHGATWLASQLRARRETGNRRRRRSLQGRWLGAVAAGLAVSVVWPLTAARAAWQVRGWFERTCVDQPRTLALRASAAAGGGGDGGATSPLPVAAPSPFRPRSTRLPPGGLDGSRGRSTAAGWLLAALRSSRLQVLLGVVVLGMLSYRALRLSDAAHDGWTPVAPPGEAVVVVGGGDGGGSSLRSQKEPPPPASAGIGAAAAAMPSSAPAAAAAAATATVDEGGDPGVACAAPGADAAAAAALAAWTRRSAHKYVSWYGRALQLWQLQAVHRCAHDVASMRGPRPLGLAHLLVLVRAHAHRRGQAAAVARTWVARARAGGARVVFVSDSVFAVDGGGGGGSGGDVTVNVVPPGAPAVDGAIDNVALHALAWALQTTTAASAAAAAAAAGGQSGSSSPPPTPRWLLLLAGDETWANVEEAVPQLRHVNARLPLVVGHVAAGRVHPAYNDFRTYPALDAGLLLTLPAVAALVGGGGSGGGGGGGGCAFDPAVRDPAAVRWGGLAARYGGDGSADDPQPPPGRLDPVVTGRVDALPPSAHPLDAGQVLGRCAWLTGVPLAHSPLMWDGWDGTLSRSWRTDRNLAPLESVLTVARLGNTTVSRGGRDSAVKGGDDMDSVFAATAWKHAPLGRWPPDAHEHRVVKVIPSSQPWAPRAPPPPGSADADAWTAGAPPGACNDAGVADAARSLREWAAHAWHPTARLFGRPLHASQLYRLHPCTTNTADPATGASHVVIVVMASVAPKYRPRLEALVLGGGWVPDARAAGAVVLLVAEAANATLGTVVVPGADSGDPSYAAAQNRSLFGLVHAVGAYPAARWFLLVDDDTWVNVAAVVEAVRYAEWRVPTLWGHILHGNLRWASRWSTYPSGGAGVLLTRSAAVDLAGALFTPACPVAGLNDVTLGACAWARGLPQVHTSALQPELDTALTDDWRLAGSTAEIGALASVHRVFPPYMHAWLRRDVAATTGGTPGTTGPHAKKDDNGNGDWAKQYAWKLPAPLVQPPPAAS